MSKLNPDAPLFVPARFLNTEDFSPEWWELVKTNPGFRDYWIRERCDLDELPLDEGVDEDMLLLDTGSASTNSDGEQGDVGASKPRRLVKVEDVLALPSKTQDHCRRGVRGGDKIPHVPAKLASRNRNAASSAALRIQQPR